MKDKAEGGKSDKNLLKRSAYALADSTASSTPLLAQAWALSKALYGNALELRQQRALEWVEAISNDPKAFSESLVNSDEFQDGFVVALEEYIKIRNFLKRRIALKIFREFALSDAKAEYPLERYNDTLQKITPAGLSLLAFLKTTIIPYREAYVREEMKDKNLGTEKPYDWWLKLYLAREPLSNAISRWITDEYGINGAKMKALHGVGDDKHIPKEKLQELGDIEREKRNEYYAPIGELEYLGLVSKGVDGGNGWGGIVGMTWTLTGFAYEFIAFIEDSSPDLLETPETDVDGRAV